MALNITHTKKTLPEIVFPDGVYKLPMKWSYQKIKFKYDYVSGSLNLPGTQGTKVHIKRQHKKVTSNIQTVRTLLRQILNCREKII